jgi:ATP-binding cassette subfamily B protein
MRAGEFSVGDLALFASYIGALSGLPRWASLMLARHRHAQVTARRLSSLLPGEDASPAFVHRPLRLAEGAAPRVRPRVPRPPPAAVELRAFGVRHGDDATLAGIDLRLASGSFTVVCGPVGSGKTTLLRGLLGLTGDVEGDVLWNGEPLAELAAHMVPPNAAYVPQVPRLCSASLRDNLTLGVARPPSTSPRPCARPRSTTTSRRCDGLNTLVGPRGVRLSGGQLQRAATARALVADPALLVLDDLSSALDAATERRLWTRLLDGRHGRRQPPTVLVVSHRAAALAHADQVVVLEGGRISRCVEGSAHMRACCLSRDR